MDSRKRKKEISRFYYLSSDMELTVVRGNHNMQSSKKMCARIRSLI